MKSDSFVFDTELKAIQGEKSCNPRIDRSLDEIGKEKYEERKKATAEKRRELGKPERKDKRDFERKGKKDQPKDKQTGRWRDIEVPPEVIIKLLRSANVELPEHIEDYEFKLVAGKKLD